MSKSHPDQWVIGTEVERPDPALVAELAELATTQVADCGGPVGVVGPGIRRLAGGSGMCGPAVTVWTKPGDILFVLKAVDLIAPGDVLLIDGGGREDAAVIGDIVGKTLADLGCVGLVVDGAVRDVDGLDTAGLPTFARGAHPATGSNTGPGAINVPVQCGGVTVRPGDVVRADGSGRGGRPAGAARGGRRADPCCRRTGDGVAGRDRGRREPAVGHRDRRPAGRAKGAQRATAPLIGETWPRPGKTLRAGRRDRRVHA